MAVKSNRLTIDDIIKGHSLCLRMVGGYSMELTSKQIYNTVITGAHSVINNRETLNRINVFPVRDGDTGSNLSSMMKTIIQQSEHKSSVKKTLESIADAALYGARGNSGIIFAQYLNGLSESVGEASTISINDYAKASNAAVKYAYDAIEEPVEGTMITLMKVWGNALSDELSKTNSISVIFTNAYNKIEIALEKTKNQLEVLRKANVVDSGAKGFTYFLEGALYYIKNGADSLADIDIATDRDESLDYEVNGDQHICDSMYRYCTECLFEGKGINTKEIKTYLSNNGDSVVIAGSKNKCRIHVHTNDPADIFEYIHEKGTIIYQKIDDMNKQEAIVNHQRSKTALVTDSIADLPQSFIDDHQIHVVHLDILYKDYIYMDKLTVHPKSLLELSKTSQQLPTSSQPSPKQIENLYDYLSTYYDSAIVLTVSKEMSGTYNNFSQVAKKYEGSKLKIHIINTKQNSGAQGLLVKKCAELVDDGMDQEVIVNTIKQYVAGSKILVQVKNLENMIKSGRLSVRAGKIGRRIGMKPIVTLDANGKGGLDSIAFSEKGSNKKILKHIKKILKERKIESYCIVHVNDINGTIQLAKQAEEIIGFPPAYIEETSSIVAIGAGQGAVALSYVLERKVL